MTSAHGLIMSRAAKPLGHGGIIRDSGAVVRLLPFIPSSVASFKGRRPWRPGWSILLDMAAWTIPFLRDSSQELWRVCVPDSTCVPLAVQRLN